MKKKEQPIIIAQIMGKWVGGGVEAVVMNYDRNIDKEKLPTYALMIEAALATSMDSSLWTDVTGLSDDKAKQIKKEFKANNYGDLSNEANYNEFLYAIEAEQSYLQMFTNNADILTNRAKELAEINEQLGIINSSLDSSCFSLFCFNKPNKTI